MATLAISLAPLSAPKDEDDHYDGQQPTKQHGKNDPARDTVTVQGGTLSGHTGRPGAVLPVVLVTVVYRLHPNILPTSSSMAARRGYLAPGGQAPGRPRGRSPGPGRSCPGV